MKARDWRGGPAKPAHDAWNVYRTPNAQERAAGADTDTLVWIGSATSLAFADALLHPAEEIAGSRGRIQFGLCGEVVVR